MAGMARAGPVGRRAGPPESSVQDRKNDRGPDRPKQFGPRKIVGPARPSAVIFVGRRPDRMARICKLRISLIVIIERMLHTVGHRNQPLSANRFQTFPRDFNSSSFSHLINQSMRS